MSLRSQCGWQLMEVAASAENMTNNTVYRIHVGLQAVAMWAQVEHTMQLFTSIALGDSPLKIM
jgi:hypothetical protein